MNRVRHPYLDQFVIVLVNDLLIYSRTKKEHRKHLQQTLEKISIREALREVLQIRVLDLKSRIPEAHY